MKPEKILIAYFSQKGKEKTSNSAKLADQLAELLKTRNIDFETFAIVPVEIYPEDKANFELAVKTELESNSRPAVVDKFGGMSHITGILLVAPNWYDSVPMPVLTWLDEYDFSDKRVVPVISTTESAAKVREEVRRFLPNTWVLGGVEIKDTDTANATEELTKAVEQLFQPSTSKY